MAQPTFGKTAGRTLAGLAVLLALAAGTAQAQTAENLRLMIGKSIVIDYPEDIRQLSTTNPDVADVTVVTTREILVHAKGLGTTDIVVWSASDQRMFYTVTVELNVDSLRRVLRESFPNETIEVRTSGDSISLNGNVSSAAVADRAAALAAVAAKTVVNNLQVPGPGIDDQVQLRVRFAELDRQRIQELGVNLFGASFLNNGTVSASSGTGQFTSTFQVASVFTDLDAGEFEARIKALETQNILQILAEPNLVTSNGKEASFLVGGEFPVPILQSTQSNAITILFKEFGIRLRFTPTVTGNGTIKMALNQEVSTIDAANSITLAGFFIPALSTRRAETNVELNPGQTFLVAGLLDSRDTNQLQKIPFIADIPILGKLFQSKRENKTNTELVMFVTPEIARPLSVGAPAPEFRFPREFLEPSNPNVVRGSAPSTR
jgi:pilus assembly protein CpaC